MQQQDENGERTTKVLQHWVFFKHCLDVMGHEVWGADTVDKMRVERTLAYHKPYTWLMQQGDDGPAEDREKWMQTALLYGIAPNIVGGTQDRARYERWRPSTGNTCRPSSHSATPAGIP